MRDVVEAMARATFHIIPRPEGITWDTFNAASATPLMKAMAESQADLARTFLRAALVAMRERMTFDAGEIDAALAELDAEANT